MPEILQRKRVMRTCTECGDEIEKNVAACPTDASHKIEKSLILVRKETVADDEDLEDEEIEDLDDEADEDEVDDEEDEDDDEDDEDEDEDEEEEDDEQEDAEPLTAVGKRAMSLEALNLSTALAEKITKIFRGNPKTASKQYEDVMTQFNGVMDTAVGTWLSGASVSKTSEMGTQASLIQKRVAKIIKEGGKTMPKKTERPKDLDFDGLPDELKNYITELEGPEGDDDVEKSDIYKGLTPAAAEIVKKAAETNEANEAQKFYDLAKSYEYVPGDKQELAKSLRHLSDTDPKAFKTMKNTLTATNENLRQSGIFKSFGSPGNGDGEDDNTKKAKELVAKGTYATIEQAQVALMDGASYKPTA